MTDLNPCEFKVLRNNVINLIRKSKQNYFDKLENNINNENLHSKLFWKTSKQLLGLGKNSQSIPALNLNNEHAETDYQKANMLSNYFSSQSVVDDKNKIFPPPKTILRDRLDSLEISPQSVKDVFDGLDVNKSCGPDLMSPCLLKEGSQILAEPYFLIFTSSLRSEKFPTQWKDSNITALHEKAIKLSTNFAFMSGGEKF